MMEKYVPMPHRLPLNLACTIKGEGGRGGHRHIPLDHPCVHYQREVDRYIPPHHKSVRTIASRLMRRCGSVFTGKRTAVGYHKGSIHTCRFQCSDSGYHGEQNHFEKPSIDMYNVPLGQSHVDNSANQVPKRHNPELTRDLWMQEYIVHAPARKCLHNPVGQDDATDEKYRHICVTAAQTVGTTRTQFLLPCTNRLGARLLQTQVLKIDEFAGYGREFRRRERDRPG